jgi:hypothetical protein
MKRFVAAALAAASVSSAILIAAPTFAMAAVKPVTLTIKPQEVTNKGDVAITAKCTNPFAYVVVSSPHLRIWEKGKVGKQLKVELQVNGDTLAGAFPITATCHSLSGKPGKFITEIFTIKHTTPWVPIGPAKPVNKPVSQIPGFNPDFIVHTGFGGMAASVATHHPAA